MLDSRRMEHRIFLVQDALDRLLAEEKAEIHGEELVFDQGKRLHLASGVHFIEEVSETADQHDLIGRVFDLEHIASIGAEHFGDSVVLEPNAYAVREGFIGTANRQDDLPLAAKRLEELLEE